MRWRNKNIRWHVTVWTKVSPQSIDVDATLHMQNGSLHFPSVPAYGGPAPGTRRGLRPRIRIFQAPEAYVLQPQTSPIAIQG